MNNIPPAPPPIVALASLSRVELHAVVRWAQRQPPDRLVRAELVQRLAKTTVTDDRPADA